MSQADGVQIDSVEDGSPTREDHAGSIDAQDEQVVNPPPKIWGVFLGGGYPGIAKMPSVGGGLQYGRDASEGRGGLIGRVGLGLVPAVAESFVDERYGSDGSGSSTRTTTTTNRTSREVAVSLGMAGIWGEGPIQWEAGAGVGAVMRSQYDEVSSSTDVETNGEWFFLGDDQSISDASLGGFTFSAHGGMAMPLSKSTRLQFGPEFTYIGGGVRFGAWVGARFLLNTSSVEPGEVTRGD